MTVDTPQDLRDEMRNFLEIARAINPLPDKIPRLAGIDIHGILMPSRGEVGGDHILYVDFNRRYDLDARIEEAEATGRPEVAEQLKRTKHRAGILLADVSGHRMTDAVVAAMLHQAFLLGTLYELDRFGEVTTRLFEHINTRFFKTVSVNKYITMLYGEISDQGRFRFLSAGHTPPMVFSREFGRFMPISTDRLVSFPPIGMFPSVEDQDKRVNPTIYAYKKQYTINEINLLAPGDMLLLYSDGLSEFGGEGFFPNRVEQYFRDARDQAAADICAGLRDLLLAHGPLSDDTSFVVIQRA